MKLGGRSEIGLSVVLALLIYAGFPANPAAAGSVTKIVESALDAKIGNPENRMAVVFMAAWCAPCIDELPTLNQLHKKYVNQGLQIIGISIDLDGPEAMQPVVSALKIDFPVYWYGEKAVEKFSLFAIPMMFLVKEGQIVERIHGRRPDSYLDEKFRTLLR